MFLKLMKVRTRIPHECLDTNRYTYKMKDPMMMGTGKIRKQRNNSAIHGSLFHVLEFRYDKKGNFKDVSIKQSSTEMDLLSGRVDKHSENVGHS